MNGCPFYFAGQQPAGVTGGLGTIPDVADFRIVSIVTGD